MKLNPYYLIFVYSIIGTGATSTTAISIVSNFFLTKQTEMNYLCDYIFVGNINYNYISTNLLCAKSENHNENKIRYFNSGNVRKLLSAKNTQWASVCFLYVSRFT